MDTYFAVAVDRLLYRCVGGREATDKTCEGASQVCRIYLQKWDAPTRDRPLNQFISATADRTT
ncbi:MAG: hypothetical protein HC789_05625 [Microcoleus sp. CSU_2_2]|nr:hypothetical protein [Microcoleus sp. SU_5_3]NJS09887.1 hypothetical protein [Microcoleus sp. CSU_2_2]